MSGSRYPVRRFQVPDAQVLSSRCQVRRFQVPGAQVSGANLKIPKTCKILKLPKLILNNSLTNINVGNLQYPSLQISVFGF